MEYWEGLLSSIVQYKAKAYIKDFHETMLMNQLELLEQRKKELEEQRIAEGGSAGDRAIFCSPRPSSPFIN